MRHRRNISSMGRSRSSRWPLDELPESPASQIRARRFRVRHRPSMVSRLLRLLPHNLGLLALALVMALGYREFMPLPQFAGPDLTRDMTSTAAIAPGPALHQRQFSLCGAGARIDCVVDGDTFWLAGRKYRIADIDTPEVSSPQCDAERRRGETATHRLRALLNAGPFELRAGSRDTDRYGRHLRTVHRDGRSLGGQLVAEGLARPWDGARRSWCA
jgi:endonuclease YncB( thermonuclease family)